jgi:hypothetical protein
MFTVETTVTQEQILGLLVTAMEGGSNYWYNLGSLPMITPETEWDALEDTMLTYIYADPNNKIPVFDAEEYCESDEKEGEEAESFLGNISQERIKKGTQEFINNYPEAWARTVEESYDAEDADVWFQLVVMNEVVFS